LNPQSKLEDLRTYKLGSNEITLVSLLNEAKSIYCNVAPLQSYPAGVGLYSQGSPAQDVYFIEQGLIKLVTLSREGEELIMDLRSAGWTLGAASAILRKPYPMSALTVSLCYLRRVPGEIFYRLLESDSRFSMYIQQIHSLELHDKAAQLFGLGYLTAEQRLDQLLLQLISVLKLEKSQGEVRLQLPLKHWEIAQLIAVTPAYVSRLLSQLEQERILIRRKGWLIIIDQTRLLQRSGFYDNLNPV
jgi:CRP/FNR family transcriptional regulator